ncbi:TPM domain-containing protein [Candidatus Acetothermia bacterium]|nr:TPM domain-containing protein [Candidatus Acetothermia bacterium]
MLFSKINRREHRRPSNLWIISFVLLVCSVVLLNFSTFAQEPETPVPAQTGSVSDYARIIDDAHVNQLDVLLKEFKEKTKATIAVLTLKTGPEPWNQAQAEAYAARVYADWKLATAPLDSNVLLFVAIDDAGQSAQVVLQRGQASQELIDNVKVGKLLDKFASPTFERKDYAKGIYETTWAVAFVMAQAYKITLTGKPPFEGDPLASDSGSQNIAIWLILLVVVAAFVFQRLKQRKPGESLLLWTAARKRSRSQTPSPWRGAFSRGNLGGFGGR